MAISKSQEILVGSVIRSYSSHVLGTATNTCSYVGCIKTLYQLRRNRTNPYLQSYFNGKGNVKSACRRKKCTLKTHCMQISVTMYTALIFDNRWYVYFDSLLNNDRDVGEDFKSQICDVITNHDSYCINCEISIIHELNADNIING